MTQPNRPRRPFAPARALAILAGAAGVGVVALVAGIGPRSDPGADVRPPPAAAPGAVAQSYSPYCQTSQGVCTLPTALPIGSPCECGGVPGQIIP